MHVRYVEIAHCSEGRRLETICAVTRARAVSLAGNSGSGPSPFVVAWFLILVSNCTSQITTRPQLEGGTGQKEVSLSIPPLPVR